jgi:ribonuclease HIII
MTVFQNVKVADLKKLKDFKKVEPKSIYERARLTNGSVTAILFTSGKLLFQGKEADVEKATKKFKGEKIEPEHFRRVTGWVIGSDETLKGDTFGGMAVAAVKADDKIRKKLEEIGVADSKSLKDEEIIPLSHRIKMIAPCHIKSILPEHYNQHKGTVTKLLDQMHNECGKFLKPGQHVVDKYPGAKVGDILTEKAESKYIEVAAASILARAAALDQFDYLSAQAGFEVPKGSTHVKEALQKMKEKKLNPRKFVKLNFRNVQEFI